MSRCLILLLAVGPFVVPHSSASAVDSAAHVANPSGFLQKQDEASQSDSDSSGPFDDAPQPSCSCDCCDVVKRLPGEINFGARVKCSPSGTHSSDMCGAQCTPTEDDKVLQDRIVDLERFCLFECKPANGADAPVQSQCVAFSEGEAAKIIDGAGNPMDPAFLYAQAPGQHQAGQLPMELSHQPPSSFYNAPVVYGGAAASANLLAKGSRLSKGPYEEDEAKAKTEGLKGRALAKKEGDEAKLEGARLRELEHQQQQKLNGALKASGDGVVVLDPFAAIQDLNAAATNARVQAEKAAIAAGDAVKAYDKGRRKIWKLALGEAGKEVLRWKKFAEDKAKREYEARFVETWQTKAMKKAQKASQPYIEAMLRAQESVKLYNAKGVEAANAASAMWKEAQAEGDAANKLPRRTIAEDNLAKSDMLDAREKAKQAQTMAMDSRQYFATAAEVRKGIPQFQYSAQKAAAQAVAALEAAR